jgi:Bacterial Ig-like domain (group 3)/MBG domain (YGX type)/FG-GAP-like repeat/FG-GAP repeat
VNIKRRVSLYCILPSVVPFLMLAVASGQAVSTSTVLSVSPAGPVASGTVVTLTATVVSGTTPVNPGQVKFCDATAAHCEDSALLATAQLTSAGIATYKFRPGIGSHSYQAVFVGTKSDAKSVSTTAALTVTVTGPYPTTTTISSSGVVGDYTLTATVGGTGSRTLSPTGEVSFLDTTNSDALLGTATLGAVEGLGFTTVDTPGVGSGPGSIVAADFNGDGILDLAVTNGSVTASTLTVLLGNGDGTFTTKSNAVVGVVPSSVIVGDFNGDGIPDLVAIDNRGTTADLLLGNGDGTFTFDRTILVAPNSSYLTGVVVGDFNGDGVQDLAVTSTTGDLSILLGNGDGTFTTLTTNLGTQLLSVTAADFNGDGILDLVTYDSAGTATVLLGNGDGTFTAKSPTIDNLSFVAVADFNGDGIPDLLTGIYPGTIAVQLGNGDGTFTAQSPIVVSDSFINNISLGDFNGDGIMDIAAYSAAASMGTVLLGKGDGTFTIPPASGFSIAALSIAAGDFNGDGLTDLATLECAEAVQCNDGAAGTVTVLLNQVTETAELSNISVPGSGTHQVAASYSGDTHYTDSTSTTVPLLTGEITPTLNLASSANGTQITLTSTLSPYSAGTFTTNGETITFYNGGTVLGTGTLSSGVATLNISSLPAGTNILTAAYSGDGNFAAAASNTLSYTVIASTLQLSSSSSSSVFGTQITLTATLSPYSSGSLTTNGETVTFYNGSTSIGAGTFSSGVATLNTTSLPVGSDTLTAVYAGDANFIGVTSNSLTETVTTVSGTVSTYVVTTNADTTTGVSSNCTTASPNCSLRDALAAAAANGAGNIIFDPTIFATQQGITLTNGTLNILSNTTITGPTTGTGSSLLQLVAVVGAGPDISVGAGVVNATISGLAISGGNGSGCGMGLYNDGSLTLSNSAITGNDLAQGLGGAGLCNDTSGTLIVLNSTISANFAALGSNYGAGIYNAGTLTLTDSTVSSNNTRGAIGGGIFNQGTMTMMNSTVSGNTVYDGGGCAGVCGAGSSKLTITSSTISGNQDYDGGTDAGVGGATVTNSIVSGNITNAGDPIAPPLGPSAEDDCDGSGCPTNGVNGNLVGANGLLAPLGNYGGPTQTVPPLPGSPAICAGLVADIPAGVTTDQRDFPRTTTYGNNPPCVDSGSVQTNYSVSFSTEPPSTVAPNANFTAAVLLNESANPFPVAGIAIPLLLGAGDNGTLSGNSASTTANGIATFSQLQVSAAGTGDTLVANLPITTVPPPALLTSPISVAATSSQFDVVTSTLPTTTTLQLSPSGSLTYGQQLTLTAIVTESGGNTPTGTVTFNNGATTLGMSTLNGSGVATLIVTLPAGAATLTADYGGSATSAASNTSVSITVSQANLTVTAADATRVVNTPNPTFTGTVSGAVNGDTFTATYSTAATTSSPAGTYPIVPAITGANIADYNVKLVNGTLTITNLPATTTTLASSAMSVLFGTSVTFTASVSTSATSTAPTGTIQLYDGSTPLGSAITLTGGSASYSTASLSAGTHMITAVYSGDANFASSTSAAITENIEDVTLVLGSPSVSVAPGGSATETLTLTALGDLNEATTFACSGLPAGASCSFNPSSVTGNGSTTLTITTTGNEAALDPEGDWFRGGGAAFACIILLSWPNRRRRWAKMLGIFMLCFVFSATGCGGGSMGHGGGGGTGSSGTPAGTYTITVTTTTGSGASAISNTVTFQLIVT